MSGLLVSQSQHDRGRCRRPLSGGPLTDRIFSRANRSVGPRRNRPPGQIGNSAARLSCGDMPPGKRRRLGPLNPHSKVMESSNQLGHFINALKQSLNTTKTTHIRHSHKPPKVQHMTTTCTTRQDFPTPEEYCSTKGAAQADAQKTARLTTDEAERHTSAIHVQARPCELHPTRRSVWRVAMASAPFLRPLVAPSWRRCCTGECPFSGEVDKDRTYGHYPSGPPAIRTS